MYWASNPELVDHLERDPYPIFAELREDGPIHWIDTLDQYFVVDYEHVNAILLNSSDFVTGTKNSLIYDTFGENMLTVEGGEHLRFRSAFRGAFAPKHVREAYEQGTATIVDDLIDGFVNAGEVDLRASFAARLPILVILEVFGLDRRHEATVRRWYDHFERALANFAWDAEIRRRAAADVEAFHEIVQRHLDAVRGTDTPGLLTAAVNDSTGHHLTDHEIRRNALIVMFGGISTVEALLLNTLFAIFHVEGLADKVRCNPAITRSVVEETMRWLSPVQSATRHVARDTEVAGVALREGDTVNCMIGAANRDPKMFAEPDRFDLRRENVARHLGFAAGPHFCLGSHLARLEVCLAINALLQRLRELRIRSGVHVEILGSEFRQPKLMPVAWNNRQFR